ncbi:MAG: hypothetical protein HC941_29540, partial [Microcoleus sp. SU_5_3]|nr:hypothetical protein [Microcoleus sp. SU_5_3]
MVPQFFLVFLIALTTATPVNASESAEIDRDLPSITNSQITLDRVRSKSAVEITSTQTESAVETETAQTESAVEITSTQTESAVETETAQIKSVVEITSTQTRISSVENLETVSKINVGA